MSLQLNILSTRPVGDEAKAIAAGCGAQLEELSFIRTESLLLEPLQEAIQDLGKKSIVAVFTSMNAVEAVAKLLQGTVPEWQVACLGQATRGTVESLLPLCTIVATAPDAAALGKAVAAWYHGPVHFFCNARRRPELPDALSLAGIPFTEWVVYQSEMTPQVIQRYYAAILFFSPSAVQSFFSVNTLPATTTLFATGHTTAAALRQYTTNPIVVAEAPGKAALLDTLWGWLRQNKT